MTTTELINQLSEQLNYIAFEPSNWSSIDSAQETLELLSNKLDITIEL